jgi:hypothetical protein
LRSNYWGLRDAVADPAPPALSDVAAFECCTSAAPPALAEAELPPVVAPVAPAPVRPIDDAGFGAAALEAAGAAVTPALLAAGALLAGWVVFAALDAAGFVAEAVDSSEPAASAVPVPEVLETPAAV